MDWISRIYSFVSKRPWMTWLGHALAVIGIAQVALWCHYEPTVGMAIYVAREGEQAWNRWRKMKHPFPTRDHWIDAFGDLFFAAILLTVFLQAVAK